LRRMTAAVTAAIIALTVGVTSASTALSRPPVSIRTQPIVGLNAVLGPQAPLTTRDLAARMVTRNGYRVPMAQVRSEMRQMAALAPAPRTIASTKPKPTTTTTVAPTTTVVAYDPATSGMGAPGSFQACVAWRESSDGTASSDVYGILQLLWSDLGFAGSPYDASLATQDAAFWKLYDMDGTQPWAPYDGC
jgi:hypothetical protein